MKKLTPRLKIKIFQLIIISSLMIGCESKHYVQTTPYKSYYALINKTYLEKMGTLSVVASRDNFVLYEGLDLPTRHGNRYKRLVLETKENEKINYYLFDDETVYEKGQIVVYSPPFIISLSDTSENDKGVWFYAQFYDEKDSSGVKFQVDAEPNNHEQIEVDTEGIYLFENGHLKRICTHQTEDCFNLKRIDGLYFLPSPGKFYRRFDFEEINSEIKTNND